MTLIRQKFWRNVVIEKKATARMKCPKCGESATLEDHQIDGAGLVTPSVVCGAEGCEFHDLVLLEGY